MPNSSNTPERSAHRESSERDELRTIGFRMREIQRLLSVRVEQENRRLEADGIERVPAAGPKEQPGHGDDGEE